MVTDEYINIFTKIAWDFGLLSDSLITHSKVIGASSSSPIEINKELETKPTTLYLMQHLDGGCKANCAFCVQGASSKRQKKASYLVSNQMIRFPLNTICNFLRRNDLPFKRICIQTVLNKDTFENLMVMVEAIKHATQLPVSADCIPLKREQIAMLHRAGLNRITINYELSTPKLFDQIRGKDRNSPYRWDQTTDALDHALDIFGPNKVLSHLIVGIGETDREALSHLNALLEKHIVPSMLSFRPLEGTDLESMPRMSHARFHALQIALYLLKNKEIRLEDLIFDVVGNLRHPGIATERILDVIHEGKCFLTSGCPHCNRPNYTVDPGERHYTYPAIPDERTLMLIDTEMCDRWRLLEGV
jgi:biotin synthase